MTAAGALQEIDRLEFTGSDISGEDRMVGLLRLMKVDAEGLIVALKRTVVVP